MKVSYNGFTGELVGLQRESAKIIIERNPFVPFGYDYRNVDSDGVYELSIYDAEKKATISFTGVKLEDVKFFGGMVSFDG